MFLSFGDICLDNLPDGDLQIETIDADSVEGLLGNAGKILGAFDFGPVPSDKASRVFGEILSAVTLRTGVTVDPTVFFSRSEGLEFPIPIQILKITPDRPMLCVSYCFTLEPGASIFSDAKVAPDTLQFRLLSCKANP